MKIEMRAPDTLHPYPGNPRDNDAAVDAVAKSIKTFGFRQPIVVNHDGIIIVGHTRWKAAVKLGIAEVPVHVADGMTPEEEKAYRLADNRTAGWSTWNPDLLALELALLTDVKFDTSVLGFSQTEITALLTPIAAPPQIGGYINDKIETHFLTVHFRNLDDRSSFSTLVNQDISPKARFIWFPPLRPDEIDHADDKLEIDHVDE